MNDVIEYAPDLALNPGKRETESRTKESFVYETAFNYFDSKFRKEGFYGADSPEAEEIAIKLKEKNLKGQPLLIVGTNVSCHNTGIAAIEVDEKGEATILASLEEERFDETRFSTNFPENSLGELEKILKSKGKSLADTDAWVNGWNYPKAAARGISEIAGGMPMSCGLLVEKNTPEANFSHVSAAQKAPSKISAIAGERVEMVGMDHHKAHAAAYFVSPFYREQPDHGSPPTMILVTDGYGDNSSVTEYFANGNEVKPISENLSMFNSLGVMYSAMSSSIGGFPPLQAEGRIMGAAGFAENRDRENNTYYKKLKEARLVILKPNGQIEVNKDLVHVWKSGLATPYSKELKEILGEPVNRKDYWNPDQILHAEDYNHLESSKRLGQSDRLDKAAALQMILEDAMEHIVGNMIEKSGGSTQLVLSGGVALNCQASLFLAERFGREFYKTKYNKDAVLEIWTPPFPSDTGIALGAALEMAHRAGIKNFSPLKDAFLGGLSPTETDIRNSVFDPKLTELKGIKDNLWLTELGDVNTDIELIADKLAYLIANGQIVGLFQGPAESGPRALGHRSILANPRDPELRNKINELIKKREAIRPVAPLMTENALKKYMNVPDAFAADNYNTLNYMVMALRANELARKDIPAVVHNDGTSRVQIVRQETDPFTHAYLKKLGERIGVEVSINTSLNVGSPIVQTPEQAVNALRKSGGMGGILMIADNGKAFMVTLDMEKKSKSGKVNNNGKETRALLEQYTPKSETI